MVSRPRSPLRIVRSATPEAGAAWAAVITSFDPESAELLKHSHRATVYRATLSERDVILKFWGNVGCFAGLRARLGLNQAHRHWHGATLLAEHGIPTARPLALLRERSGAEWLVMPALEGRSLLGYCTDRELPVRTQHALAAAAGRLGETMHKAGLFNRDQKPSNIIVLSLEPEALAVIDCVGIRRSSGSLRQSARMLSALYLEPTAYGHPPRRAVIMRGALGAAGGDRTRARQLLRLAAQLVRRHGLRCPRINPFAPP